MITRSIKLSINEVNTGKNDLIEYVYDVVSFITFELVRRYQEGEKVNYSTLKEYNDLGAMRLISQAWHGFINVRNNKGDKPINLERFTPLVYLDDRIIQIEKAKDTKHFEYWLKVRDFDAGKWIHIPITTYSYAMVKYLENPNWKLKEYNTIDQERK